MLLCLYHEQEGKTSYVMGHAKGQGARTVAEMARSPTRALVSTGEIPSRRNYGIISNCLPLTEREARTETTFLMLTYF